MDNLSSSLDLVFGALADPTRRAVLERLGEGEASIGELAQPFDMALPSLMKHVRKRGKSRGGQAVAQRCLTIAGK